MYKGQFKTGDFVVKSRPYNSGKYCYHGGEIEDVPLGTTGYIMIDDEGDEFTVRVKFNNGIVWSVHEKELSLGVLTLKQLLGGKQK